MKKVHWVLGVILSLAVISDPLDYRRAFKRRCMRILVFMKKSMRKILDVLPDLEHGDGGWRCM